MDMEPITTINRTIESILSNEKITLTIKQVKDTGSLIQIAKPTNNVSTGDNIYSKLIEPNLVHMTLNTLIDVLLNIKKYIDIEITAERKSEYYNGCTTLDGLKELEIYDKTNELIIHIKNKTPGVSNTPIIKLQCIHLFDDDALANAITNTMNLDEYAFTKDDKVNDYLSEDDLYPNLEDVLPKKLMLNLSIDNRHTVYDDINNKNINIALDINLYTNACIVDISKEVSTKWNDKYDLTWDITQIYFAKTYITKEAPLSAGINKTINDIEEVYKISTILNLLGDLILTYTKS
jgi:hypothetical protein